MKTLSQILFLVLLTLGSCTSRLYTGAENDDLYYLPSDKAVVKDNSPVNEQLAPGTTKNKDYYDNIYAGDTLVSDQYSDAVDYNGQVDNNSFYGNEGYDYYNNYPYSTRLRMFYGNYFDPFWRDPFYLDYGMGMGMGMGFGYGMGYGGYPYYGYGMGYGGMYGDYYGGYPGYYGYYGGGYFGSLFYGGGYYGAYPMSYRENKINYSRNERPSNLSPRWNSTVGGIGSSRRDNSSGLTARAAEGRISGSQTLPTAQRRTALSTQQAVNQTNIRSAQAQSKGESVRSNTSVQRNAANGKPVYNSSSRSYTPSYNNPRMSTRPSYNNSRVSDGANSNVSRSRSSSSTSRIYNSAGAVRTPSGSYHNSNNNVRSNSSGSNYQRRTESSSVNNYRPTNQSRSNSYRSSESYSVPSRSSVERSSSSYSRSSSSGGRSYSSGSPSGSYSSGSSSGSSSSGSGSSSRGGGSSSSGRR